MKVNSAYARLPLNGAQLPDLAVLDALAADRRRQTPDLRPRLVKPVTLVQLQADGSAQALDPKTVAAWLRAEVL
jgi:hypothetical protein